LIEVIHRLLDPATIRGGMGQDGSLFIQTGTPVLANLQNTAATTDWARGLLECDLLVLPPGMSNRRLVNAL